MTIRNMANMNTLFKKGYILAGVVMAANMFAVNEMKAMEQVPPSDTKTFPSVNNLGTNQKKETFQEVPTNTLDLSQNEGNTNDLNIIGEKEGDKKKQGPLYKLLSWENYFNFFGTLALSGANNYFKWWDYNAGSYCKLRIGCLGWRTKKLFDIVQLDFNLNLGRGISWVILGAYNFIKFFTVNDEQKEGYVIPLHFSFLVANFIEDPLAFKIALIAVFLLQGFLSIPLTFHISNFSISISLDSTIWGITGFFLDKGKNNEKEEEMSISSKA